MRKLLLLLIISSFFTLHFFAQSSKIFVSNPYPNPAVSSINFDFSFTSTDLIELKIYNIIGEELTSIDLHNQKASIKLNTSSLNPGVYFFSFQSNEKTLHTGKFYIKI